MPHPVTKREVKPDTTPRGNLTHIGNWTLGRTLGRGAYAHVRLATHVSGREAACKILPALHRVQNEPVTWDQTVDAVEAHKEVVLLKALSGLKFPGVVELEGVIEREGWTYMFSTLHQHSAAEIELPWDHERLINFFRRLCLNVHALHQLDVSHEDIKRSNVLVDQISLPALIDFGFSHFSPYGHKVRSAGGTLDYSSPEKTEDKMYHGPATDVWSLGILLGKLLGMAHPFINIEKDTVSKARAKIIEAKPIYDFRTEHIGHGRAGSLIMQMLEPDPRKRITLPEVLEHKFLSPVLPDPYPFRPPSYTLPSKYQGALPFVVIQDLCFLAYLNKEFFLCETPSRIQERVYVEEPCWEKRWARMLLKWKQREEMDWEDLPFPIKPMARPRQPLPHRRSVLREIHLDPRVNMDDKAVKATAHPTDKPNHAHHGLGLHRTKAHTELQGSPPKRARTGQDDARNAENPARGRLPAPNERERDQPVRPRIVLGVKPVPKRHNRATPEGTSPRHHRTAQLRPRIARGMLSSSSSSLQIAPMQTKCKDLLGSESTSPPRDRDDKQSEPIGPINGMRGLALAVPEMDRHEQRRRSSRIAAKEVARKPFR